MALVPQYDPTLDRQNMAIQASLLQNLGAQVRRDIQTVQTNRQTRGFVEGLSSVDPKSPEYFQQITELGDRYPFAANNPLVKSVVSQMGAEHTAWTRAQLDQQNPWRSAGQGVFYNSDTGDTKVEPSLRPPVRPTQIGSRTRALQDPTTGKVTPVSDYGLEMPEITNPITLEEERQNNRMELERLRQAGRTSTNPQVKALNTQLNGAMSLYMKKQAEAAGLQSLWEQSTPDPNNKEELKEKWRIGMEANAARQQAEQYKKMIEQINSQLGPLTPSMAAQIPSIPATPATPEAQANALMPETIPTNPKPSGNRVFDWNGKLIPVQ